MIDRLISLYILQSLLDSDPEWPVSKYCRRLEDVRRVMSQKSCFDNNFNISFDDTAHTFQCGESAVIGLASPDDISDVNKLLKSSADDGEGFAVDEFSDQGKLSGHTIYSAAVVVVKTSSGNLIGAVIFGPSKSVLHNPNIVRTLGGYIIIKRPYRRRGIGREFLELVSAQLQITGTYSWCISDCFCCDLQALTFAQKVGFSVTGTIYFSGVFKNHGLAHTLLLYRPLGSTTGPALQHKAKI